MAEVSGVDFGEITSMTIVIGGEAAEEGGTGLVYVDDIYLCPVS